METLGQRIKHYRTKLGLTQQQLGNRLGFSLKAVSKWEKDEGLPDIFVLHKMSKILDFSIDEVLNSNNFVTNSTQKLIDVLDIDSMKTGAFATYEEIHTKGFWHAEIGVWIGNKKGEYLMQRRADNKKLNPNKWAIAAGHVYSGETDLQAAVRIVENEYNITPSFYNLQYLITEKQKNGVNFRYFKSQTKQQRTGDVINRYFSRAYILRLNLPIEKIKFNKSEVLEVAWMSLNQIKKLVISGNTIWDRDFFTQELEEDLEIDLLDIVDEKNNYTGKVEEKQEIHERGLWHRESLIWVGNRSREILCYKRVITTTVNPGLIVPFFGGHVLSGETYEQAAIREIKEETGLETKDSKKLEFVIQTKKEEEGKLGIVNRRHTQYFFVATNKKLNQFKFPQNEVPDAFFMNIDDVKKYCESNSFFVETSKQENIFEMLGIIEEKLNKIYKPK